MPITYTPLRYPGGKSQFYRQVVNILSANNIQGVTYVEPFAGGAGVGLKLLINGMVKRIIINDIDEAIYSFWWTVLNDNSWIVEKIRQTEITLDEWKRQKTIYLNPNDYSVRDLGFSVLFLNRCNRSGIMHAGPIGGKRQLGKYKLDCRFNKNNLIKLIKQIGGFKNRIDVYNLDASELIKKLKNRKNLFWFIDPPYFSKGAELYKNAFSFEDHIKFADVIKKNLAKHTWILTYDVNKDIYDLYKAYNHEIIYMTYSVESRKKERELLFYNKLEICSELLNAKAKSYNV